MCCEQTESKSGKAESQDPREKSATELYVRFEPQEEPPPNYHELDYDNIDDLDEIDGDEQLALIYCDSHRAWEWHYIDRGWIEGWNWRAKRRRVVK
jgi:hypothetical protein